MEHLEMKSDTLAPSDLENIDQLKLSAVDALAEEIRKLIEEQNLQIGDPLPTERELAERFNAGRNTVREAMQILRAYGVIETRPKVGAIISGQHHEALRKLFLFHPKLTPDSFHDVQDFRRMVEIGVGETIILNVHQDEIEKLHQLNEKILQSSSADEAAKWDYRFHEGIVELAGNRTVVSTYRMIQPVLLEIMRLGKESRSVYESTYDAHKEIIDALMTRDRVAYAYLVSRHLQTGMSYVAMDDQRAKP